MKIIAFYLPQYHTFRENDEWWGKGFTEWVNVKKSIPLFEGHNQPRVPLGENYYDLTNITTAKWQAELAKKYGIYGFCYYHYWFDGKLLMEKPMENMLRDKTIDLPFCICWANENWTKAWAKKSKEVLLAQNYENKDDWDRHFQYFLKFFRDERYIKVDEKPLLIIYRPELISCLEELLLYWNRQAQKNGFQGISYVYQQRFYNHQTDKAGYLFDYGIEYQPGYAMEPQKKTLNFISHQAFNYIVNKLKWKQTERSSILYDYDKTWQDILQISPKDNKMLPGAFVDWDNTPRYKGQGSLFKGVTPDKFRKYLSAQIKHAKEVYKKDMIFMFAWNEWGEGGYLEPDERNGYKMLEAIKHALLENGEFPQ